MKITICWGGDLEPDTTESVLVVPVRYGLTGKFVVENMVFNFNVLCFMYTYYFIDNRMRAKVREWGPKKKMAKFRTEDASLLMRNQSNHWNLLALKALKAQMNKFTDTLKLIAKDWISFN